VSGVDIALRFIAPDGPDAFPLLLHRPEALAPQAPLLVCVHGYTRQPLDHLQAFAPAAAAAGFALLLPLFRDSGAHRMYQQLLHPRRGTRSDLALLEAVDRLAESNQIDGRRIHLFGYSGGAQYVHRLAMLHPQRVASLGIGAAGWYTWPDWARPWPQGLEAAPATLAPGLDFDAFLRLPMALWVGERDNAPDTYLRDDPALNALQGSHRLERASRWAAAVRQQAAQRGIAARVTLDTLPHAGHDFLACHRKAGLADRAMAHAAQSR
jgi:pimeloyl-ACP methyl ester carboxylesterase